MNAHAWATTVLVAAIAAGCGTDRESITPKEGPITESVYASGMVKAQGQYQVYPTVSGNVLALLVKEGDTVKAGQPLMRIDDRTSSFATGSAEAQLQLLERNASDDGPVLTRLRAAVRGGHAGPHYIAQIILSGIVQLLAIGSLVCAARA
ncbi:MAG TPA: biotin/lipoyl-binding protein, partial [Flavobacteriales bacterium]|nr:biotin/lipoyl-binding protein [Flavobacteriales bacterium]